jgi:hypothetical protein
MPSYKDYAEEIVLLDNLPTYEPTEQYYLPPLTTSSSQQQTMQYIIAVSAITSFITTCCIFYTGKCIVYIRTKLKERYLGSDSSDSFEIMFENVYT